MEVVDAEGFGNLRPNFLAWWHCVSSSCCPSSADRAGLLP